MASDLESESSGKQPFSNGRPSGWLKVGAVAAASALAGGLAAAWYYRGTLNRLRQEESHPVDAESSAAVDDLSDDI